MRGADEYKGGCVDHGVRRVTGACGATSTARGEMGEDSGRVERKGTDRTQNSLPRSLHAQPELHFVPKGLGRHGQQMAGHEPAGKLLCWCLQGGSRAMVSMRCHSLWHVSHKVPFPVACLNWASRAAVSHEVTFPVACLSWAISVGGTLGCSRSPAVLLDKEGLRALGRKEANKNLF